ncbi:Protein arginine N-methyltransferase 7 [Nibea albiflora]|nr:Protein arginine N-methyltransferase 7 [Nibea albiflora]
MRESQPDHRSLDWVEESEEYDYHQEIARSCYADMLHDHDRVFKPMAEAAKCIVKKNGFSEKIRIINKHSTDVTVGPDGDMQTKANVLITELFDTELIGEGALPSYEHAHLNLVQESCEAVPHRATVYAQLVESELLWSWAQLQPVEVEGARMVPPPDVGRCAGAHSVCDIQLSQVSPRSFTPLGPLCTMFSVDFSKPVSSALQSHSSKFAAQSGGRAQVVLSWWDLDMDPSGSIVCTMAPSWTYPEPETAPSAVYFLPAEVRVTEGDELSLTVCHDDYSLWYSLQSDRTLRPGSPLSALLYLSGSPGLDSATLRRTQRQAAYSELRQRAAQRPEGGQRLSWRPAMESLLPVFAHMLGAKKVYGLENSRMSKQVLSQVNDDDQHTNRASVQGVPYATHFSRRCWKPTPSKVVVQLLDLRPEQLSSNDLEREQNLWRIRAPCGTCEGFDVTPMDEMVQRSLDFHESREAEPHPLWEYPCRALTRSTAVMTFDFTQCVPQEPITSQGSLPLIRIGRCHGVALWMEYHLTDDITVSAGLIGPISEQGECEWSRHRKQGVYFLRSPWESSGDGRASVAYSFTFEPGSGDIKMDLSVESQ